MRHPERHRMSGVGWLRAAVLGANDGLISTSSLVVGVAAADPGGNSVFVSAVAGLTAGAFSMAAGEFVSVSSQADTEKADLARERQELADSPEAERNELIGIYQSRGLSLELATRVADELTATDALGVHAREELGLTESSQARPFQAALASAAAFAVGALPPVVLAGAMEPPRLAPTVGLVTLVFLAGLGALAARLGGAPTGRGAARIAFWGALAMAASTLVGRLFGAAV